LMLKIGIWSLILLMPLFTFNSWNNPIGGVSLLYSQVNLIFTFIALSIPAFSSLLTIFVKEK
jgi:hypothetical protein